MYLEEERVRSLLRTMAGEPGLAGLAGARGRCAGGGPGRTVAVQRGASRLLTLCTHSRHVRHRRAAQRATVV